MLKADNIYAGYGGDAVLRGVTFSADKSLAVIGPNGSGKTTLLRCIAGLMPFSGDILIDGAPVAGAARKTLAKKVALLSQISHVYFQYNVFETVMMGRYAHMGGTLPMPSPQDRDIVEDAMLMTGVSDLRARELGTLSGGQLQRVMLAKTFAQMPQIILLDEPVNHLDIRFRLELIEHLKLWKNSVIGVFHDITLAMDFCDDLMLMCGGRAAARGSPREVAPCFEEVYGADVTSYMKKSLEVWREL